jgi:flagellar motility protein MotE (MotC chaperone)
MTATFRGSRSSVMLVLAGLFFVAGVSRIGLGVADVLAADTPVENDPISRPVEQARPDPGDLYAALQERMAQLDAREEELRARANTLNEAELELHNNIERLLEAEAKLKTTLRLTESAAEDDLRHLTTVFESMKPIQAAELFSQMDTEFAAGFVARLKPEFAGEVMSALDPLIAYGISAVLAGRHARTPRH